MTDSLPTPICFASLDDEPQAHVALRSLLSGHRDLVDCGAYGSARAARDGIARRPAELLFLDFQLAGSTGFEFLATLDDPPVTVLFTAHADYAIEAFERGVRDYLLKPVSAERVALCLERVRPLIEARTSGVGTAKRPAALAFFCGRGHRLIAPDDIIAIDADGNFSWLLTVSERILVSESMKALESRLELFGLMRVHKGHMVHRRHLQGFDSREVQLSTGLRRPIGRAYRDALDAIGRGSAVIRR